MKRFFYILLLFIGLIMSSCERQSCYFVTVTLKFPDGRTRTQQSYAYGSEQDARIKCDLERRKMIEEFAVDSAWIECAYERMRGISKDDCGFGEEYMK